MKPSHAQLGGRLGLDVTMSRDGIRLRRGELTVSFDAEFNVGTVEGRHTFFCACLGARLGIDRLASTYDPSREREEVGGARNPYEVPSHYGGRLQQLIPSAALDVAAHVAEFDVVRHDWLDGSPLELAYVHEFEREFHLLGTDDVERLPYSLENITEYARYALFYDAYDFRPDRVERSDFGTTKWFRTTNGQAASRATLFPDLDYDAARVRGAFALVDRDEFIVVEPTEQRSALAALRARAREAQPEAPRPFSRRVYHLTNTSVHAGETFDGQREFDASAVAESVVDVSVDQTGAGGTR